MQVCEHGWPLRYLVRETPATLNSIPINIWELGTNVVEVRFFSLLANALVIALASAVWGWLAFRRMEKYGRLLQYSLKGLLLLVIFVAVVLNFVVGTFRAHVSQRKIVEKLPNNAVFTISRGRPTWLRNWLGSDDTLTVLDSIRSVAVYRSSANAILLDIAPFSQDLTGLRELVLYECQDVGDETIPTIARFETIEFLDLRGTSISDGGIREVARMPRLATIDARGTDVTSAACEMICNERQNLLILVDK